MQYTQRLTLSMAVPTIMVAGAGLSVVAGAHWLAGVAASGPDAATQLVQHLGVARDAVAVLTALCVGCCIFFAIWIRRSAQAELGGDPADARQALAAVANCQSQIDIQAAPAGSLMHSLQRVVVSLRQTVGTIRSSVDSIGVATSEIATGNADLSARTEHAASSLQQTASSMGDLTDTLARSAGAAQQARQLAASARSVAQRGGQVMSQVVGTMDEINAGSRRITDIVGVIDGIAFQTNILALNAAVEAARAGDQGRGFAVVAGEVRLLAKRSADAAREIKSLIGSSVTRVEAGTLLVTQAGATMTELVASVQQVTDTIDGISAATEQQHHGLDQVNSAVNELDRMTQQNAALVEQSAAAAESLRDQTARLTSLLGTFQLAH